MPGPRIIDITGKTPHGDLLLQSAPDTALLHSQLSLYFKRVLGAQNVLTNTAAFQSALNLSASNVPELNMYAFEPNQRVGELAATLVISRTMNRLNNRSFIPAWQRAGQDEVMQAFTSKKSWDGFVYEHPKDLSTPVFTVPIEIKSLMITPGDSVTDPDRLLKERLPQYERHFQSEGSICAVFVMPYTSESSLSFDLKEATVEMNKCVAYGAMGSLCFLSFPSDKNGNTIMTIHCCFISKNPEYAENGNIHSIELGKMTFGKVA